MQGPESTFFKRSFNRVMGDSRAIKEPILPDESRQNQLRPARSPRRKFLSPVFFLKIAFLLKLSFRSVFPEGLYVLFVEKIFNCLFITK
ncbi:MAG: hypothetical protein EA344_13195 [Alkalicoccus sp.]|nr:MAG: hypothetical protein EA344_13195 [Alkalicoccus sp.]